ncbi:chromosome condensation regulator RCC1, partial [Maribacter sp.]|nr:chromosome condensation regulator RCC1 [Maribacter sp.]
MLKIFIVPLLVLLCCSCSSDDTPTVEMESTTISSPSFEQALITSGIDADGILNGRITTDAISNIIVLSLAGQNISDLSGIENFSGLKKLDCSANQLSSLDLSKNTALKELDFSNNQVTSIDVGQNTALTSLVCFNNRLSSLNLSQNTALATLACTNNQLVELDLSLNTVLTQVYCSENQLSNLDVTQNTDLIELFCFKNQLSALDISSNMALTKLYCYDNELTALNVKNGNNTILTEFNFSENNELQCVQVDNEIAANSGQAPYNIWIPNTSAMYSEDCSAN